MDHFQDKQEERTRDLQETDARSALIDWVNGHVDEWEDERDKNYKDIWDQVDLKFNCTDANTLITHQKGFARSTLCAPALQQAVEDGAADCEEVVFGKEGWFDISDNPDGDRTDFQLTRIKLLSDMEDADVNGALLECFFYGSLYGTMLGKIVSEENTDRVIEQDIDGAAEEEQEKFIQVKLEPISPRNFIIDTGVNRPGKAGIEMALGMAHRLPQPKHKIIALQNDEIILSSGKKIKSTYWLTPLNETPDLSDNDNIDLSSETVMITEYHGLVPSALLNAAIRDENKAPEEIDTADMVESVVTYADAEHLLMARENTNLKRKRDFVSCPWDIIPGKFWGRGTGEKALPSQKALDIFLRGQVDA
ncbi:MAG: hypothetical protein ACE5J5_08645, partial [Candidatus Hydrothermarchaeales archaeon]